MAGNSNGTGLELCSALHDFIPTRAGCSIKFPLLFNFTRETMEDQELKKTVEQTIAVLSETFMPEESLNESAKRYTSVQVAQAIYDLTGASPSIELIYQVMQEHGYRYVVDETSATLKYVWLLKYKNR